MAALDFKYQAAVKENDAATMETILADDFALVAGSGKVYRKADLPDVWWNVNTAVRKSVSPRLGQGRRSLTEHISPALFHCLLAL
jgi:hypothetical protein